MVQVNKWTIEELWDHLRAMGTDPAPFWDQVKVSWGIIWEPWGLILPLSGTRSRWAGGSFEILRDWSCPFLGPGKCELGNHLRALGTDPAPFWDQVKVSCRNQVTYPSLFWAGQSELRYYLRTELRTELSHYGTRSRWAVGSSESLGDWSCPFLGPGQGELWDHLRALWINPAPGTRSRWAAGSSEGLVD